MRRIYGALPGAWKIVARIFEVSFIEHKGTPFPPLPRL